MITTTTHQNHASPQRNSHPIQYRITNEPYLVQGARLLLRPGYKRFILVPLACNLVLFVLSVIALITYFQSATDAYLNQLPEWLHVLKVLISTILFLGIAFLYSLTFTSITNLLAAPFNGLLAEKIQQDATGQSPPDTTFGQMAVRTIGRELQKLLYFISYGLGVALLIFLTSFIPGLNVLTSLFGLAWASWVLGIQYIDYVADNNQVPFKALRRWCGSRRLNVMFFGALVLLITIIPLVNVLAMSVSVAGGALLWINENTPQ